MYINQHKHKTVNIKTINSDISNLLVKKMNLSIRLSDIEKSIPQGFKLSDIPKDSSTFNDEKYIRFVEKVEKIKKNIDVIDSEISSLRELCNTIVNTINSLPDCNCKTISQLYFIDCLSAKEICCRTGISRSVVYKEISSVFKSFIGGD